MSKFNKILTAEDLSNNYNKLLTIINKLPTNRKERLLLLFNDFEDRIMISPASTNKSHHGAYPGGLVEHLLNVCSNYIKLYKMRTEIGFKMAGYSFESGLFCALVHDLGKLGTTTHEYYIQNESEWHREKQGKLYEINEAIGFMKHEHRTLFLLQQYQIELTENEWISILNHGGLFEPENECYWKPKQSSNVFKTKLDRRIRHC